ncbi:MAG: LicD family protein [Oligoflexia bacterium]|nr:LicD family protein [Oligoflexia bacterium]
MKINFIEKKLIICAFKNTVKNFGFENLKTNTMIFFIFNLLLTWNIFTIGKIYASQENQDSVDPYKKYYFPAFELRNQGKYNEAIKYYELGLQIVPNNAAFNYQLAMTFLTTKNLKSAKKFFLMAQNIFKSYPDSDLSPLVETRLNELKDININDELDQRLDKDNCDKTLDEIVFSSNNLVDTDNELMKKIKNQFIPLPPEGDNFKGWYFCALNEFSKGNFELAKSCLLQSIRFEPKEAHIFYHLSNIEKEMARKSSNESEKYQHLSKALKYLSRADKISPRAKWKYLKGFIYKDDLNNKEKALEAFEDARGLTKYIYQGRDHLSSKRQIEHLTGEYEKNLEKKRKSIPIIDPEKVEKLKKSAINDLSKLVNLNKIKQEKVDRLQKVTKTAEVIDPIPQEEADAIYNLLESIDSVLKKNNIKYTMIGGTLLGAIRNKGLIPWDDDGDIAVREEDISELVFEKLTKDFGKLGIDISRDPQIGLKVRYIDDIAPAIDIFTMRNNGKGEYFYAQKWAYDGWPTDKITSKTWDKVKSIPFGHLNLSSIPEETAKDFLDICYGADWNYVAYKSWDHFSDKEVKKELVIVNDRNPLKHSKHK